MKKEQLTITIEDYAFLKKWYSFRNMSAFNKDRLSQKLQDANIVLTEDLPSAVVRANSNVLVCNLDRSQTFSITIVSSDEAVSKPSEILISDPLAIALLGYQPGSIAEWEMQDGIARFQIVSVSQAEKSLSSCFD